MHVITSYLALRWPIDQRSNGEETPTIAEAATESLASDDAKSETLIPFGA